MGHLNWIFASLLLSSNVGKLHNPQGLRFLTRKVGVMCAPVPWWGIMRSQRLARSSPSEKDEASSTKGETGPVKRGGSRFAWLSEHWIYSHICNVFIGSGHKPPQGETCSLLHRNKERKSQAMGSDQVRLEKVWWARWSHADHTRNGDKPARHALCEIHMETTAGHGVRDIEQSRWNNRSKGWRSSTFQNILQ